MSERSNRWCLCLFVTCALSASTFTHAADQASPEDVEFFEKKIRPVLVEHCYQCHASDAKKIRGGLLLDTRMATRQGGDSGPGVVPGKPDESLVLEALRQESFEMPPSGPLPDAVIADFEKWIQRGAVDPRDGTVRKTPAKIDIEQGKKFWAFQPLQRAGLPDVHALSWPETPIDRFVLSRLERENLAPVADADRVTLIRRAYYALLGLPPTPAEISEFLEDPEPDSSAFSKVIDRLLESQRFGERWGRHWLDVVRFAESSGGGRTLLFPDAWRYRDYVIEAFNSDRPYDEFLMEQIAGDLLESDDWQQRRRQIVATSFLVLGPTNYELQDKDILEMDIVDEQLDTIGKALLGMTIGCARCHDHKFDPIPTTDYYAMAGILKSTKSVIHSNVSAWNTMKLPLPAEEESALQAHEQKVADMQSDIAKAKKELKQAGGEQTSGKSIDPESLRGIVVDDSAAELRGEWTSSTAVGGFIGSHYIHDNGKRDAVKSVTFAPKLPKSGKYEVQVSYTPSGNRSTKVPITIQHADGTTVRHIDQTKQASIEPTIETLGVFHFDSESQPRVVISNQDAADGVVIADAAIFISAEAVPIELAKTEVAKPDDELIATIKKRIADLEKKLAEIQSTGPTRPLAMAVTDEAEVADIHLAIRGIVHNQGEVVRRGVLQVALHDGFEGIPSGESGRAQLASWIAHPQNPLTARVIVNRTWYWLFGEGLVRTVDNFGAMGEPPSHPELLDYLAEEFIREGWSIKTLIRKLMQSRIYRLSSVSDDRAMELDPGNRLHWRMNRQRMDAESIRDTLLFIGGELDFELGGPNIKAGTKIEYDYQFDSKRRSVYLPVFRNTLPEIFSTFDFADPNVQGGKRTTSTIAPQALLLMNDPFVIQQSRSAAKRLLSKQAISSVDERIQACYRQVLGRYPNAIEHELAADFVGRGDDLGRWSLLYQALFQSLDFRYLN